MYSTGVHLTTINVFSINVFSIFAHVHVHTCRMTAFNGTVYDIVIIVLIEMLFTKAEDRSSTNGLFNGLRFSINPCLSGDARAAVARETERRGG